MAARVAGMADDTHHTHENRPGLQRGERAPDMVLPTPQGTPTHYYAHAGGRPALLVSTPQLLDDLEGVLCLDRRRVHATGMSNGAIMSCKR